MNEKSTIATLIRALAIITYGCGVFLFFVGAYNDSIGEGIILALAGLLSGTMLLGFSEIIRLLHEINQKTK